MRRRVVITGVGTLNGAFVGGSSALDDYLAAPYPAVRHETADGTMLRAPDVSGLIDETEARRLSHICQLAVAAARLAHAEAGFESVESVGVVVGTEFGDQASSMQFAEGYLRGGPTGLSPLLFPNTVMNTMAASTTIAVAAKNVSLTLNAPTVAGELAVAHAAAAIAAGRLEAMLAGGVDHVDTVVRDALIAVGADADTRGDGATVLALEAHEVARARGARALGEIRGWSSRALPAPPYGIGRTSTSRAIADALAAGGCSARELGWVLTSTSGDTPRDAWERRVLEAALAPYRPSQTSLVPVLGHHAGLGALRVAVGAWTARSGWLPMVSRGAAGVDDRDRVSVELARVAPGAGLVHGLARGGTHVALVIGPPPE